MSLGKRIKDLRLKKGFTQQYMADKLKMGRSNFGHIENDRVTPTSEDLQIIADILETSEGIKRPQVEKKPPNYYDEEEARQVIQALQQEPRMWRLLILGAMIGGFRRGELLALEWSDVNFEDMTISINKSISLTKNGEAIIKSPKTQNSIRTVDMPAWYMQELKEYYHEWKINKMKVRDKWLSGDREFVFHGGYGKPLYHTTPTTWWRRFIKRHGLRYIRFHDLRHSAATLLIEAGESLKTIQERLGHSKYSITADTYAHVTKKVSREAANKLEKFAPSNVRPQSVPKC